MGNKKSVPYYEYVVRLNSFAIPDRRYLEQHNKAEMIHYDILSQFDLVFYNYDDAKRMLNIKKREDERYIIFKIAWHNKKKEDMLYCGEVREVDYVIYGDA